MFLAFLFKRELGLCRKAETEEEERLVWKTQEGAGFPQPCRGTEQIRDSLRQRELRTCKVRMHLWDAYPGRSSGSLLPLPGRKEPRGRGRRQL